MKYPFSRAFASAVIWSFACNYAQASRVSCTPACSAPTPICGADNRCTDRRWVEPISTLPRIWSAAVSDTKMWTKWVRSIVPIVGQASTEDAALLEVAYYAESVLFPGGKKIRAKLVDSMLGPDHPTIFSVYPACPKAYMHPAVKPTMSSGGGGWANTLVSEDWVLQYPKCTGALAVTCDKIPEGTKCNNCQWQNAALKESCLDTLAHEHGHTMDLHHRKYIDKTGAIDDEAKRVFGDQPIEGPAWAASQYLMNPSRETNRGRKDMSRSWYNYWKVTHGIDDSLYTNDWGYKLKPVRCPKAGLTEACPDTLKRTLSVPLDDQEKFPGSIDDTGDGDPANCDPAPKPIKLFTTNDCTGASLSFSHSKDTCHSRFPDQPTGKTANFRTRSVLVPPGMRVKLWDPCVITWNYWDNDSKPGSRIVYNHLKTPQCVPTRLGSVGFMSSQNTQHITSAHKKIWFTENADVLECTGVKVPTTTTATTTDIITTAAADITITTVADDVAGDATVDGATTPSIATAAVLMMLVSVSVTASHYCY